jgi:catechol 2,3-dioxygenase-like lactoylglutathione lyase family enzyme
MKQPITGYHKDNENHWVAELACGHFQHVRHDPPMANRLWTQTAQGRQSMMGFELHCVKCDEGAPPDQRMPTAMIETTRTNTIFYCGHWIETVEFYRDTLKLPVQFENDWFVEFQLTTTSYLSIANADNTTINAVNGQGVTLTWQVADLQDLANKLRASGVQTTEISRKWNALSCFFHDPEGHRIELWQPDCQ